MEEIDQIEENEDSTEQEKEVFDSNFDGDKDFLENFETLVHLTSSRKIESSGLVEIKSEKQDFIKFQLGEKSLSVRKSSFLWMISNSKDKLSNDRLVRVKNNAKKIKRPSISESDFILLKNNEICNVIHIVKKDDRREKYVSNRKQPEQYKYCLVDEKNDFEALVAHFLIEDDRKTLKRNKMRDSYVELRDFVKILNVKTDVYTKKTFLINCEI
jgi:hypothetical protein